MSRKSNLKQYLLDQLNLKKHGTSTLSSKNISLYKPTNTHITNRTSIHLYLRENTQIPSKIKRVMRQMEPKIARQSSISLTNQLLNEAEGDSEAGMTFRMIL